MKLESFHFVAFFCHGKILSDIYVVKKFEIKLVVGQQTLDGGLLLQRVFEQVYSIIFHSRAFLMT
jgi:hypothetical protein